MGIIPAADHGDDAAVEPHRDQRHLGAAEAGAADGADGEALKVAFERGLNVTLAIAVVGEVGRLRKHPVGEIGAARHVVARTEAQARGADRGKLGVGEEADFVHRAEHQLRPAARRFEMGAWRQT